MAKQSGVQTLTCLSLDTCEDKHRFSLTDVNTLLSKHTLKLAATQPIGTSASSTAVWLVSTGPTNVERQVRVQSGLAVAVPHVWQRTQQHTPVLWLKQLLIVNTSQCHVTHWGKKLIRNRQFKGLDFRFWGQLNKPVSDFAFWISF